MAALTLKEKDRGTQPNEKPMQKQIISDVKDSRIT
jgi:hypothetical protein